MVVLGSLALLGMIYFGIEWSEHRHDPKGRHGEWRHGMHGVRYYYKYKSVDGYGVWFLICLAIYVVVALSWRG